MSVVINLDDHRRQREQDARPMVFVECRPDPDFPDRTEFTILSRSREAVEGEIKFRIAHVESYGKGHAAFDGPYRKDGIYEATGCVVMFPDVLL